MVGRKAVMARSVHPGLLSYRSGNGRVESLRSLSLSFICMWKRKKRGQRCTEGEGHLAPWCIRVCMSVHVISVCTDILSVLSALSSLVSFFSCFVYLLSFIITPTVLPSGHVSYNSRVTCAAGTDLDKPQPYTHIHIHRQKLQHTGSPCDREFVYLGGYLWMKNILLALRVNWDDGGGYGTGS